MVFLTLSELIVAKFCHKQQSHSPFLKVQIVAKDKKFKKLLNCTKLYRLFCLGHKNNIILKKKEKEAFKS